MTRGKPCVCPGTGWRMPTASALARRRPAARALKVASRATCRRARQMCVPGEQQENANGVCGSAAQGGAGGAGAAEGCVKGHVPWRRQTCVCPGDQQENANGVCGRPAARERLKCDKGHVPRGASVSARATQENDNGVCVGPGWRGVNLRQGSCAAGQQCVCPGTGWRMPTASAPAAGGRAQLECVKGHVPKGKPCVCPGEPAGECQWRLRGAGGAPS